jgi:hypothetical protein
MNVDDLRAALHEQAGTVADHDPAQRAAGVHERVRVVRRRRVVGAAALTVTALAVVSAVMTLPATEAAPPADDGPTTPAPSPLPTVQHEGFVQHSGEFDLVAAKTGKTGQSTLSLTVPPHAEELHVAMSCHGLSGPAGVYWVSGYGEIRPARPWSTWCGGDPDVPVVPGVFGSDAGPWSYDDGLRFGPSTDPLTVHVELTQELDDKGDVLDNPSAMGTYTPVTNPDVVLGIGVYKIAKPVVTVLGTEIRPLVGINGVDYAYVDHRAGKPGERRLTWTLPASPKERYYDVVSDKSQAEGNPMPSVTAMLDDGTCQTSWAFPRYRAGGCLLSARKPHTITVIIDPGMPEDAVAGIVLYERAE